MERQLPMSSLPTAGALPSPRMVHEMMVGLTVTDDATYQQYRDAMAPLVSARVYPLIA